MTYRAYTENDVRVAVSESLSIADVLRKLGLKQAGGNYANIKRKLQTLNIDTSHFTGIGWNKDQQLKDWSDYKRASTLKPHLIKVRGNVCECCKNSLWLDKPIKLEIHHVDGDRTNNREENLQLLCPNCHSYTDTWRGRNRKG
jgi:hypothetical protein